MEKLDTLNETIDTPETIYPPPGSSWLLEFLDILELYCTVPNYRLAKPPAGQEN